MEHTTVKDLVSKHKSFDAKLREIRVALSNMQNNGYHETELIERARKDKRYPVLLLVQEYDKLLADIVDLENTPVRFLRD